MLRVNLQIEDILKKKNKFNAFNMNEVARPLQEVFLQGLRDDNNNS